MTNRDDEYPDIAEYASVDDDSSYPRDWGDEIDWDANYKYCEKIADECISTRKTVGQAIAALDDEWGEDSFDEGTYDQIISIIRAWYKRGER